MFVHQTWSEFFSQLGPMGWPLLLVSMVALALLGERLWFLLTTGHRGISESFKRLQCTAESGLDQLAQQCEGERALASRATALLLQHRNTEKMQREEVAAVWLQEQRRRLHSGLRLLMVIGIISPLMGLLGTVLGLIGMFAGLSGSHEAVTPALLADGLGMAMHTTAAGLMVALPAIAGAHLLAIWSDRTVADLEHLFNRGNLWLEGLDPCACKRELPPRVPVSNCDLTVVAQ
ncbi:MotA/TolQ/ExbB proton channel family protein [Microbulbifer sp. CAU 1566]|uniref:MotA/TolQ/ExbB proton channel family protein n=1 Tax=Microbulbifer sp. CAU 1566 TaxID=2933269 RepID=UPI002003A529|nr:MotA/TolQ/ExbB proton channel family protein [Microbulbifer sp. CAU 1566]MCK7596291.1 MotA/TolQ/ExbB proton channel family protein [Microbulbifer sp. CAU 1566]